MSSNVKFRILNEENVKSSYVNGISCECGSNKGPNCTSCYPDFTRKNASSTNMSITVLDESDEHCHDDEGRMETDKKAKKKLLLASLLCVFFMVAESVGGIMAGSLAVATDAAHLLTDFAGFMISLFAIYIAERPATKRLSYGYHRAEVIGALTSVLLIWVVTGILVFMAAQRIVYGDYEIDATIMLVTSGIGLVVNVIMGCTLHQHGHSHGGGSHGHSHGGAVESPGGSNAEITQPRQNINVRAAFIHVIGDFIQSVGVFAAALIIYFKPDAIIVDPICTFVFSILVVATTFSIIKDTLVVLMEGIPKGLDFNEVRESLLSVRGVRKLHNLRLWSLSTDRIALSAHLAVEPNETWTGNTILRAASSLMKKKFGFSEVTIQIEDFHHRMQDCLKCQELN